MPGGRQARHDEGSTPHPVRSPGTRSGLSVSRGGGQQPPGGDAAGASPTIREEGGMYARSTTVQADPQRIDDGITYIRDEVMPAVTTMPGCMGLSMLCDRDSARCIITTSWDSEESMSASRDAVRPMRE